MVTSLARGAQERARHTEQAPPTSGYIWALFLGPCAAHVLVLMGLGPEKFKQ